MARFQIIDSGLSNILFESDDFNEVYEQALDYLDNNRSCTIKIFDQDTKISIPVTYDDIVSRIQEMVDRENNK